jgi:glucokinase
MAKTKKLMLGVDIGGTKIAAGLVSSEGKILYSAHSPMVAKKSASEGLRAVLKAIDHVLRATSGQKPSAVGVSVPGWVDSRQGVVLGATNLPCWHDFPLVQEIENCCRLPVHLANDANAAALAEAAWGAGAGYRNVFYVTLGAATAHLSRPNGRSRRRRAHDHQLSWPSLRMRKARLHRNLCFRDGDRAPNSRTLAQTK